MQAVGNARAARLCARGRRDRTTGKGRKNGRLKLCLEFSWRKGDVGGV